MKQNVVFWSLYVQIFSLCWS